MNNHFNTIDPNQSNLSDLAVVEKVMSEKDRLPEDEHEKAAKAFLLSDSIASGIARDFAFVKQIPQYIKEIIENKLWECLYVAKGVMTPYYCRYTKGTDSENFRAFITAKRPNGLETTIDEVDNILNSEPEVQRLFRTLIYESRQGERTDLANEASTSYSDYNKLDDSIGKIQQARIRAANRAAEAIPIIGELLDRGLIAIDLAAQLGRDIKDPDNLTADEREYVEDRDLIGLRIKQYINTNIIPEDEYKEPAYRRELNSFVKDLLGIKDRSKQVRMDNPKKAADKLLTYYQGERLRTLIDYLQQGYGAIHGQNSNIPILEPSTTNNSRLSPKIETKNLEKPVSNSSDSNQEGNSTPTTHISHTLPVLQPAPEEKTDAERAGQSEMSITDTDIVESNSASNTQDQTSVPPNMELNHHELAERLGVQSSSLYSTMYRCDDEKKFTEWSRKKDPDGVGWQRTDFKKGRSWLFIPVQDKDHETIIKE